MKGEFLSLSKSTSALANLVPVGPPSEMSPLSDTTSLEYYTLINAAGLFQPKFGSNMDKPKCWVKNAIKTCTV